VKVACGGARECRQQHGAADGPDTGAAPALHPATCDMMMRKLRVAAALAAHAVVVTNCAICSGVVHEPEAAAGFLLLSVSATARGHAGAGVGVSRRQHIAHEQHGGCHLHRVPMLVGSRPITLTSFANEPASSAMHDTCNTRQARRHRTNLRYLKHAVGYKTRRDTTTTTGVQRGAGGQPAAYHVMQGCF
jgi:hypothetical protein